MVPFLLCQKWQEMRVTHVAMDYNSDANVNTCLVSYTDAPTDVCIDVCVCTSSYAHSSFLLGHLGATRGNSHPLAMSTHRTCIPVPNF